MRDRIYCHITWTTWERAPIIDRDTADFLTQHIQLLVRQEHARAVEIGIVEQQVDLLLRLHPSTAIPHLVQRMKRASATLAVQRGLVSSGKAFRWARGYDIESVSPGAIDKVREYVRFQRGEGGVTIDE